jgi:hypothetical protein
MNFSKIKSLLSIITAFPNASSPHTHTLSLSPSLPLSLSLPHPLSIHPSQFAHSSSRLFPSKVYNIIFISRKNDQFFT